MNGVLYAFVFNGKDDWRKSIEDSWDMSVVEITGQEKVLGHKKIDGAICKILQTSDGKVIAVTK